jgi:hypothetical protein
VKIYLLSRPAGNGPLDLQQGAADLVADGDLASVVCDCHGRCSGTMMLPAGAAAGEKATATLAAGGFRGGHGTCTTAGAKETASSVVRTGSGSGSVARTGSGSGSVATAGKHVCVCSCS